MPSTILRRPISRRPISRRPFMLVAATAVVSLAIATAGPAANASPRTSGRSASSVQSESQSQIAADADWLLQGQLPDGAIAWYVDKQHISPYQANYAAIGLAEARAQTGSRVYGNAAWSWLSWYAAHEDANGFVTDYDVDAAGAETSTGDEDSTDAYAGTFLTAVRATFLADGSYHKLRKLHDGVAGAVAAIEATQDSDGLTWAKPTWHVKYLMDQAETYNGLLAAVDLAMFLGDRQLARRAARDAAAMKAGIASLWDDATGAYDWAKGDGGWVTTTNWSALYPDAMEQAWIAGSPAINSGRASALLASVQATHPQWDSPAAVDGGATVGYWPVAGWAFLRAGQTAQAQAAAASIRAAAVAANRGWPFTTGVAGELIVLESGDASLITPFTSLFF